VGHIIHFANLSMSLDSIASFELKAEQARIEVTLKAGREYTLSYANDEEAKKAYNSIKATFSNAGYDSTFITF